LLDDRKNRMGFSGLKGDTRIILVCREMEGGFKGRKRRGGSTLRKDHMTNPGQEWTKEEGTRASEEKEERKKGEKKVI